MMPEERLWRAVLLQAFQDAVLPPTSVSRAERSAARHWLTSNREDFETVCLFAGVDPSVASRCAHRLAARNWVPTKGQWIAQPGRPKRAAA